MKELGAAVLVLICGAIIGMVIEKAATLALTGQSFLFFTRVYGSVGVHPLSFNISVSGILGLIISYILILRLIKVLR
ncbi:MAG: hypothetical protein FWF35_01870 [Elusimicrobia bacterium]|nr:hypothetical protein [Elusimicrobiota bacterium]